MPASVLRAAHVLLQLLLIVGVIFLIRHGAMEGSKSQTTGTLAFASQVLFFRLFSCYLMGPFVSTLMRPVIIDEGAKGI